MLGKQLCFQSFRVGWFRVNLLIVIGPLESNNQLGVKGFKGNRFASSTAYEWWTKPADDHGRFPPPQTSNLFRCVTLKGCLGSLVPVVTQNWSFQPIHDPSFDVLSHVLFNISNERWVYNMQYKLFFHWLVVRTSLIWRTCPSQNKVKKEETRANGDNWIDSLPGSWPASSCWGGPSRPARPCRSTRSRPASRPVPRRTVPIGRRILGEPVAPTVCYHYVFTDLKLADLADFG